MKGKSSVHNRSHPIPSGSWLLAPGFPKIYGLTQTLADVPETDDWLGDGERERLATLRFPKRRNDWRLGRWTAKRLVASFLELPLEPPSLCTLEIRAAADGAPEVLLDGFAAPVSLSISHSAGIGFCVVAPRSIAVGCDLETIRPHEPNFADDYFTADEIALIDQAPAGETDKIVTLVWSAKESALKVLREGLRRDTRTLVTQLDPWQAQEAWHSFVIRCTQTQRIFPGWWRTCGHQVETIASDRPTVTPLEAARSR